MSKNSESVLGLSCMVNDLLSQAVRPTIQELGLTTALFDLLSAIHAADGRESQAEIGRRLGLSRATISEAITSAVTQQYVERKPSEVDGRANVLILTPKAHRCIQAVLTRTREVEQRVVAKLKAKDQDALQSGLRKVIAELGEIGTELE